MTDRRTLHHGCGRKAYSFRQGLAAFLILLLMVFAAPSFARGPADDNDINGDTFSLPYQQLFGDTWHKSSLTTWQLTVPISVKQLGNDPLVVNLDDSHMHVKLSRKQFSIVNEIGDQIISDKYANGVDEIHLLFETDGHRHYHVQLVQTAGGKYADATPFILWEAVRNEPVELRFTGIRNKALKTGRLHAMAGNANPMNLPRPRRDTSGISLCAAMPIFAIANMFLRTHCDTHYFYDSIRSMFSAGSKHSGYVPLTSSGILKSADEPPVTQRPAGQSIRLSHIYQGTAKYPFLSAYAISQTCMVPFQQVTNNRKLRGNDERTDCIFTSADILNIYTRAFGQSLSSRALPMQSCPSSVNDWGGHPRQPARWLAVRTTV